MQIKIGLIENKFKSLNVDSSMISASTMWEDLLRKDSDLFEGIKEHGFIKPTKV
jgi:hypothetical protein